MDEGFDWVVNQAEGEDEFTFEYLTIGKLWQTLLLLFWLLLQKLQLLTSEEKRSV